MRCWDYRWKKVWVTEVNRLNLSCFVNHDAAFSSNAAAAAAANCTTEFPRLPFFKCGANCYQTILEQFSLPQFTPLQFINCSRVPLCALFSLSLSFVFLSRPNGINYFYIRRQFWGHFLPSGYTVAVPAPSVVTFVFSIPVVAETVAAVHRCTVPKVPPLLSYTVFPFWQLK